LPVFVKRFFAPGAGIAKKDTKQGPKDTMQLTMHNRKKFQAFDKIGFLDLAEILDRFPEIDTHVNHLN